MGVSWKKAFSGALLMFAYSLAWLVIGGIIIYFSYKGAEYSEITTTTGLLGIPSYSYSYPYQIPGIIGIIAGFFIISFGCEASALKVWVNITADEVERRLKPSPTQQSSP